MTERNDRQKTDLENVDRIADLLAADEISFPIGLPPELEARLVEQVRARRKATLVRFIARQIALDIFQRTDGGGAHDSIRV